MKKNVKRKDGIVRAAKRADFYFSGFSSIVCYDNGVLPDGFGQGSELWEIFRKISLVVHSRTRAI
jgi:hypothetical protein